MPITAVNDPPSHNVTCFLLHLPKRKRLKTNVTSNDGGHNPQSQFLLEKTRFPPRNSRVSHKYYFLSACDTKHVTSGNFQGAGIVHIIYMRAVCACGCKLNFCVSIHSYRICYTLTSPIGVWPSPHQCFCVRTLMY